MMLLPARVLPYTEPHSFRFLGIPEPSEHALREIGGERLPLSGFLKEEEASERLPVDAPRTAGPASPSGPRGCPLPPRLPRGAAAAPPGQLDRGGVPAGGL